jgi:two-component system chemotaxis sensor kinase CheA
VVVYSEQGQSVGLVVDRILDIVEVPLALEREATRQGVRGSAVIQDRVTDLVDVRSLVSAALGRPFSTAVAV